MTSAGQSVRAFIRSVLRPEAPIVEEWPPLDVMDLLASQSFESLRSGNLERSPLKLAPDEEKFLQKIAQIILRRLGDPDFDTRTAAREAHLSRMHLNRKLQAMTGCSTHDFVLALRFRRARELLREESPSVSDVAHAVGFRSPSHFSKAFRKHFGLSPSDFIRDEASKEA